jgi:hypothetical protein
MTTAAEKASVEFTETGAVYKPGNGHEIEYKKLGGVYYHVATPDAVVRALEQARSSRQRVRIYLGDTKTGRDWLEEHDVEGYIGNSTGPLKVPRLIPSRRSLGGPALLDHCIVRVKWTTGGILYQHPSYHTGTLTIRQIGPNEEIHGEKLLALGYSHAVDVDGRSHANFKSLKAAERYLRRITT